MELEGINWILHLAPVGIGSYAVFAIKRFNDKQTQAMKEILEDSELSAKLNQKRYNALNSLALNLQSELEDLKSETEENYKKLKTVAKRHVDFKDETASALGAIAKKTMDTKEACFSHVQQLARSHQIKQNRVDDRLADLESLSKHSLDALYAERAAMDQVGIPKDIQEQSEH